MLAPVSFMIFHYYFSKFQQSVINLSKASGREGKPGSNRAANGRGSSRQRRVGREESEAEKALEAAGLFEKVELYYVWELY